VNLTSLFLKKLLVAFLVGAAPTLLAFVSSVGTSNASFTKAALLTLASGAIAAGLRAAFAIIPGITLVPSDADPVTKKP
jgi:hypothetical protein